MWYEAIHRNLEVYIPLNNGKLDSHLVYEAFSQHQGSM